MTTTGSTDQVRLSATGSSARETSVAEEGNSNLYYHVTATGSTDRVRLSARVSSARETSVLDPAE